MDRFRPKYVTFDCHGTLINFQMAEAARDLFGHLLDGPSMDEFIRNFQAYRIDEVLQDWKPYADVVHNALERTCRRNKVASGPRRRNIYNRVPTWGRIRMCRGPSQTSQGNPLVILTNSHGGPIPSNVAKLGAPFHAVYTAEEAGAYNPTSKAFEYMFDMLGCGPEDITHVSSSFRHDLISAYDLGIKSKVWSTAATSRPIRIMNTPRSSDISQLPGVFGL